MPEYVRRSKFSRRSKLKKRKPEKKSVVMLAGTGFDKLWESTEGESICPSCESVFPYGHIRELKDCQAVVDWVCAECGYEWSSHCDFEDGCLTVDDGLDMMMLSPDSGDDDDLPLCSVSGCGRRARYFDPSIEPLKPLCRLHALNARR